MGVRDVFPDSLSFTVDVQIATIKRLRVPVTVDLQDRLLFLSASIVYEVLNDLEQFLDQLSDITANQLAFLKWDGTPESVTAFQWLRILPGVHLDRGLARFSFLLEESIWVTVQELTSTMLIRVYEQGIRGGGEAAAGKIDRIAIASVICITTYIGY